jgi:cation:H+ antiporter
MLTEFLGIAVGALIIFILADFILKKTLALSHHFGFSNSFVGITVLSIGTSTPEILTHIIASIQILQNSTSLNTLSSLVIGTNVGSNIFQQTIILSLVAVLGTIIVKKKELHFTMGALIATAGIVLLLSIGGFISRFEAALLIIIYIAYLYYLNHKKMYHIKAKNNLSKATISIYSLLIIISFGIMGLVTNTILNFSQILIASLPISASFFGVVVLGIASALPELSTALVASLKHQKGISAGVLIGSNITNPLFALGLGGVISGYSVPNVVTYFDLPAMMISGGIIYYLLWKNERMTKPHAMVLLGLFFTYIFLRLYFFPADII